MSHKAKAAGRSGSYNNTYTRPTIVPEGDTWQLDFVSHTHNHDLVYQKNGYLLHLQPHTSSVHHAQILPTTSSPTPCPTLEALQKKNLHHTARPIFHRRESNPQPPGKQKKKFPKGKGGFQIISRRSEIYSNKEIFQIMAIQAKATQAIYPRRINSA